MSSPGKPSAVLDIVETSQYNSCYKPFETKQSRASQFSSVRILMNDDAPAMNRSEWPTGLCFGSLFLIIRQV